MTGKLVLFTAVVVAAVAYYTYNTSGKPGPTVTTKSGSVRGIVNSARDGRDYYSWLGIPYARPPVQQLRFADPEPVVPWDGVLDGSKYGNSCLQVSLLTGWTTGNEDCLFLNVHTPQIAAMRELSKLSLPVIFYIHGGGYFAGDGNLPVDYLMDEDVVVVSVNYRLGILGFMTTGDEVVRGNMGLKDQTLALRWVKENIQAFGGDPKQVTIFGTSAGGASVHMQTLSKLSKGLFQRAVSQSGAASNPWAFIPLAESLNKTGTIAVDLKCPAKDSQKLVECLRKLEATNLIQAEYNVYNHKMILLKPHEDGIGFVPTVEAVNDGRAFITEHPLQVVAQGGAHGVPHLFGHTTDEGLWTSSSFRKNEQNMVAFESKWEERIRQLFQLSPDVPATKVRKVLELYVPQFSSSSEERGSERLNNYTDMLGDSLFAYDIRESANLQRRFSPVYYYVYAKRGGPSLMSLFDHVESKWPRVFDLTFSILKYVINSKILGIPPADRGVTHAEDMFLLMGMKPLLYISKEDEHYGLSKDHVKFFVDFAKDDTSVIVRGAKLPQLTKQGKMEVLEINDDVRVVPEPFESRMKFLNSLNIREMTKI